MFLSKITNQHFVNNQLFRIRTLKVLHFPVISSLSCLQDGNDTFCFSGRIRFQIRISRTFNILIVPRIQNFICIWVCHINRTIYQILESIFFSFSQAWKSYPEIFTVLFQLIVCFRRPIIKVTYHIHILFTRNLQHQSYFRITDIVNTRSYSLGHRFRSTCSIQYCYFLCSRFCFTISSSLYFQSIASGS